MKRLAIIFILTTAAAVIAQPSREADPKPTIEQYSILKERNIFNPNRAPNRSEEPPSTPSPRIERMRLTGTLVTAGESLAFIDGPNGGLRKKGDSLGEWTISAIATEGVVLVNGDQTANWRVGGAMERSDDAPWQLSDSTASATHNSSSSPSSTPSSGASAEDILRRLRERRNQELQNE